MQNAANTFISIGMVSCVHALIMLLISLSSFPVPVSAPVLRAVNKVIVGKPFSVLCEAENGTLPITYTLLKTRDRVDYRTVVEAADRAIFNITSINFPEEIYSFTCQAHNRGSSFSRNSEPLRVPVIGKRTTSWYFTLKHLCCCYFWIIWKCMLPFLDADICFNHWWTFVSGTIFDDWHFSGIHFIPVPYTKAC